MFRRGLSKTTQNALALLGKSGLVKNAYLAGGTGASLHLGHRFSFDLDFFTQQKFDEKVLVQRFEEFPNFTTTQISWGTILGNFADIKFSLFYYRYPLIGKLSKFSGVNVASLPDIAAMKINAISDRGLKRDFVDLYFICQRIPLQKILECCDIKYKNLKTLFVHIKKSLIYFTDAEGQEMPEMLVPISWGEIKEFFVEEDKKLTLII